MVKGEMREPFHFQAPGRLIDFMRQADQPGLINLAAGVPSPDSLPYDALREAFDRAIAKEGRGIFAYHHPEGDHVLRHLLAERLEHRGVRVRGSDLVLTTGCSQALQLMLSILVQPGDIVACEAPAYYALLELISRAQARVLPIPVKGVEGIDLQETKRLLERWRPRCFVVCSSLSNPSGATLSDANREELVQICRVNGVRLVEDDIYAELVDGGAPKPLRAFDDGSTVSFVSSFSKSVSPGIRVGYAVPGTVFEAFATLKCQQDLHSVVPTEVALRTLIEMDGLDRHLNELRPRNRHRREIAMKAIGQYFPQGTQVSQCRGGFMLWVELPREVDLASIREKARAQNVAFAAGHVFFAEPVSGRYLRLNCSKASESNLTRGLEILGKLVSA